MTRHHRLNAEFHARPPVPLVAPVRLTHLAFLHDGEDASAEKAHLGLLCAGDVCRAVEQSDAHLVLEHPAFRVRWELHTEFSSYTFFAAPESPGKNALADVPSDWLANIPGERIVATHIEVVRSIDQPPEQAVQALGPVERQMVVAQVVDGLGWVLSDFQFEDPSDPCTRFMLIDQGMTRRQIGRTVQRLWEIETYRLLGLLGLPVAKEVGRWLRQAEDTLAELMDGIGSARDAADERRILDRLSALAAEVEHRVARTSFRFGASRAYYGLVMQRIDELREVRVKGFPTFREFMDRRLRPPMATCEAMNRRLEELSGRVARNSQLLRTRVDIELEHQNQELLAQMNRRARLQLRLQETVEGLSIVAITYYASQLVHYLAKAGSKFWPALSPELATGLAIPPIAGLVAFGLHRMRRRLAAEETGGTH